MKHFHDLNDIWKSFSEKGDNPAVITIEKDTVITTTYDELWDAICQFSSGLLNAGLQTGDRVVLQGDNSARWVTIALGVIMAGGVTVPLDAQMVSDSLAYIIKDCGAKWAFLHKKKDQHLCEKHPELDIRTFHIDTNSDDPKNWKLLFDRTEVNFPEMQPEEVAVQFYTSGTTGKPKGVPLTHKNLLFEVNTIIELEVQKRNDRLLNPLPFSHVYPFAACMLVALTVSVPIIIPYMLTGPELMRAMQLGEATIITGVPRLYRALFEGIIQKAQQSGAISSTVFNIFFSLNKFLINVFGLNLGKVLLYGLHKKMSPNLRLLFAGGAALPPDIALGLQGLGWEIITGYGLTETSPMLAINFGKHSNLKSAGYPAKGVELKIDPTGYEGMQDGKYLKGEVLAKGPNVFNGYHNLPEKTKEVFTDDGWFRTGDLGYFDNKGFLHLSGRESSLIVTEEGKNIDPEEVEDHFLHHELISEIVLMEREGKLVAIIVPDLIEIREKVYGDLERGIALAVKEVSEKLPSYHRPDDYVISREAIPRTRLGKIRRHKLPDYFDACKKAEGVKHDISGTPIKITEMDEADKDILDNPTAKNVWDWLVREYSDKRLTPDTNIQFDLGIDSIGWLGLTLEIRQRSGVDLPEDIIVKINTVRDLLQQVSQMESVKEGALEASPLDDPEATLTTEQKRWLRPLGPVKRALARAMYAFNRFLVHRFFGITIIGQENVPRDKQLILAPNHISHLDSMTLSSNWDFDFMRDTFWAGWVGVTHSNFITRFLSRLASVVPIDPNRTVISNLAFGAAAIKQGKKLIWYPEGMISTTGDFEKFRPGLGILANKFKIPIVPVYIEGTDKAYPKGSWWPKFTPLTVVYGKPVDPATLVKEGVGNTVPEQMMDGLKKRIAKIKESQS